MAKNKEESEDFGSFFNKMMDEEYKSWAKETKIFKFPRHNYSTGLLELDYMINPENPGILGGNIIQSAGENHSGKTGFLLNMIRDHVGKGHRAIYIDGENGLTDNYLKLYGMSKKATPGLEYIRPGGGAERYQKIIINALDGLQGRQDPVLIGVDSVPFLFPEGEIGGGVRVGGNNQTFNKFINMVTSRIGNTNAILVLLNAVYANILSRFEDYSIPGGMTLPMRCQLIMIHYKRVNKKDATKDMHWYTKVDGEDVAYRQRLAIKITKNKFNHCGSGQSAVEYYLNTNAKYLPTGPDNVHSMLQVLKDAGELKFASAAGYKLRVSDSKEEAMSWEDWEKNCYTNDDYYNMIVNRTMNVLEEKYNKL